MREVGGGREPALGDADDARGHVGEQARRALHVHVERLQVAVVDAEDLDAVEVERVESRPALVDLDEHVEPERVGGVMEVARARPGRARRR